MDFQTKNAMVSPATPTCSVQTAYEILVLLPRFAAIFCSLKITSETQQ